MPTFNLTGHVLCAMPFSEPKEVIERIRKRFPKLKVTYIESKLTIGWKERNGLPDGSYAMFAHALYQATNALEPQKYGRT